MILLNTVGKYVAIMVVVDMLRKESHFMAIKATHKVIERAQILERNI